MPCTKVAAFAKNKTRRVPPFHAKDCLRTVKKGNDGNMYLAKKTRGVCRWVMVEDDEDDGDEEELVVYKSPAKKTSRRRHTQTVIMRPRARASTIVVRPKQIKARSTARHLVYLDDSPVVNLIGHHPLLHPLLHRSLFGQTESIPAPAHRPGGGTEDQVAQVLANSRRDRESSGVRTPEGIEKLRRAKVWATQYLGANRSKSY